MRQDPKGGVIDLPLLIFPQGTDSRNLARRLIEEDDGRTDDKIYTNDGEEL